MGGYTSPSLPKPASTRTPSSDPVKTQALIVGGGCGGVAAALALARLGVACVMTEPTDWVGGQLTSQAVPPDENQWIEGAEGIASAPASYLEYRRRVRQWYRDHRPLTTAASDPPFNPGGGWVSHLCHEPRIGQAVLMQMLRPGIAAGLIDLRLQHRPIAATINTDRIEAIQFQDTLTGDLLTVEAGVVLDATELGDLLDLAGAEHYIGSDGRARFGELHARQDAPDPTDQQACCWCFALEHRPGEDHTIDKPSRYDHWAGYTPQLTPAWPGRLFSWEILGHGGEKRRLTMGDPGGLDPDTWELWRYRRITNPAIYRTDSREIYPEVSLINWVQMDYFQKPLLGVSEAEQQQALAGTRAQSSAFLYWLQTQAPRPDGGTGWPGLRLRGDELGTSDGFAKAPYIREPRRMHAMQIVTEAHVGVEQRLAEGAPPTPSGLARVACESFADRVGIGSYHLDLHPTTGGFSGMYVESCPFEVPLRALIPVRLENLLAAGKGLGVSHIANGCFRLHPVEWAVGEAAGTAAGLLVPSEPVQSLTRSVDRIQETLTGIGSPIGWPKVI